MINNDGNNDGNKLLIQSSTCSTYWDRINVLLSMFNIATSREKFIDGQFFYHIIYNIFNNQSN